MTRTLESVLAAARGHVARGHASHGEHWIVETLGAAWPCGMEEPPIVSLGDGTRGILIDNGGDPLTPDEVRGYAARLLQLAEDAER